MIELVRHIEVLLLENDCIIIPSLGGFIAHYVPASYVEEDSFFLPPTRTIGFNPQLRLNDGVLVQSYMTMHHTNFSDATRLVEKDVSELIRVLHEEGKVSLNNIGEIHYNIYDSYEFVPYDYKIATPSLYGLDSFEIKEIVCLRDKEKVWIPTKTKKYEPNININHTFLRNVAAMIAAIVLFFAFSTPIENTYIQKNNYAQLLPSELLEQFEKHSIVMTPVQIQAEAEREKVQKKAEVSSIIQTRKNTVNKVKTPTRPIVTKEVKVSQTEMSPKSVKLNNLYRIIVAGGISQKDAETIASQLKTKGFIEATVMNNEGKIRVSIYSFNNRNEATKQLLELRKNETYKDAWLLTK